MIDEDYSLITSPPPSGSVSVVTAAIMMLSICGSPADGYMVPVPTGPARVVSAGCYQRSYQAPPEIGTLTTPSPDPAWAVLTAYVIDPTAGGINRTINAGNIYQCIQSGTSASVGGPTTTASSITDGTAKWTYVGPANTYSTISGSQVVGISARGTQSTATSVPPFDNDGGGSYTQIFNTVYNGFPDSFAGVWYRPTPSNNKSNFAAKLIWGGTSPGSGSGDEATVMWIELQGVKTGAPHASSNVERASATANICTAAPITTTVPCLILSMWFGNGNVVAAGSNDGSSVPLGGLQRIPGATAVISLTTNGYIQVSCAWRLAPPGTYSETWQTDGEGAQMMVVAFQDISTITAADGDEAPYWLLTSPQSTQLQSRFNTLLHTAPDDIVTTSATVVLDDSSWSLSWLASSFIGASTSRIFSEQDDLPQQSVFAANEDYWVQSPTQQPSFAIGLINQDQNELPLSITFDEDYWFYPIATATISYAKPFGDQDELPLFTAAEEQNWSLPASASPTTLIKLFSDQDDLTQISVSPIIDEDYWITNRSQYVASMLTPLTYDQDILVSSAITIVDEDYWFFPAIAISQISVISLITDQDIVVSIIDEDYWIRSTQTQIDPSARIIFSIGDEQFALVSAFAIDDSGAMLSPPSVSAQIPTPLFVDEQTVPALPMIDEDYFFVPTQCVIPPVVIVWWCDDVYVYAASIPPTPTPSVVPQIGAPVTLLTAGSSVVVQQNTQTRGRNRFITIGSGATSPAFSRVDDLSAISIVTTENIT